MSVLEIIFLLIAFTFAAGFVTYYFLLRQAYAKITSLSVQSAKVTISEPTAAELEAKLKSAFEAEIASSTQVFAGDLKATSARLSEQVSRLTTQVIEEELTSYQSTIEELRKVAAGTMDQIRAHVDQQRDELHQSMQAEVEAERTRLVQKFETKMGDIIASYINESLGGGIDLGTQMSYIVASLEAHKADIKKDLTNGL